MLLHLPYLLQLVSCYLLEVQAEERLSGVRFRISQLTPTHLSATHGAAIVIDTQRNITVV